MVNARPRWSQRDEREPGRASGQMGHGGEEEARSHVGAIRSMGRGGVWASKAGGEVEGNSDHSDAGGWQSRQDRTAFMVG